MYTLSNWSRTIHPLFSSAYLQPPAASSTDRYRSPPIHTTSLHSCDLDLPSLSHAVRAAVAAAPRGPRENICTTIHNDFTHNAIPRYPLSSLRPCCLLSTPLIFSLPFFCFLSLENLVWVGLSFWPRRRCYFFLFLPDRW